MPSILNPLVGYVNGQYWYESEDGAILMGGTTVTLSEETFVPDWRVDEDPRLVSGYIECQSERYADRNNDEYDADIDVRYSTGKGDAVNFGSAFKSTDESKTYTPHPGYDLLSEGHVRCWYCNGEIEYGEYVTARSWVAGRPNHHNATVQAFVTDMLVHYSEHRSNGDLPWVRTYIKVGVRRPDGSVVVIPENARRVTKPWLVKGALL